MYNIYICICIDAFCCSMFFVSNLQCSLFIYQYISVFVCVVYIYIYTPYVIPRFQSFTENHLVFWWRVKFDQLHVDHALRSVLTQAKHDSCGWLFFGVSKWTNGHWGYKSWKSQIPVLATNNHSIGHTLWHTHHPFCWHALKLCLQSSRSGCQKLFLIQFYPAPGPHKLIPNK